MELNQLYQFKIVAETNNFSKAAKRLYVSQSALSKSIKKLEDELGTELFDRTGKSISLNDNGDRLLIQVNKILDITDDIYKEFVGDILVTKEALKISTVFQNAKIYFIPQIEKLLKHKISFVECDSKDYVNKLYNKEIDFVICREGEEIAHPGIKTSLFKIDRLVAVKNKQNNQREIDIQALNGCRMYYWFDAKDKEWVANKLSKINDSNDVEIEFVRLDMPVEVGKVYFENEYLLAIDSDFYYLGKMIDGLMYINGNDTDIKMYYSYLTSREKELKPYIDIIEKTKKQSAWFNKYATKKG